MKHSLAILLVSCTLNAAAPIRLHSLKKASIINNRKKEDERDSRVFAELQIKAYGGDHEALAALGDYYWGGRFPVAQDKEKAKALWTKGASLGSYRCAVLMHTAVPALSAGEEAVIEEKKWLIITSVLLRMKDYDEDYSGPTSLNRFPESSFKEAKERADAFLAGIRVLRNADAFYQRGLSENGINRDIKSYPYFLISAELGHAKAQVKLGIYYQSSVQGGRRMESSLKWLMQAAEKREADAYYWLGVIYSSDKSAFKDYAESCKWFNIGISSGDAEITALSLQALDNYRRSDSRGVSEAQQAEGVRRAKEYLLKQANR